LAVYLTRAAGSSKIYEFVYEKRFLYVQELCKMIVQGNSDASGAFIEKLLVELEGKHCNFCAGETGCEGRGEENIRAIRINGPFRLHGAEVEAKNLRAGAALILAGLMAEGQTVVWGARHVRRGYENLPHKLRTLGAEISEIGENE
jgi:UDP-N-acetylglucosamine enolpyruvyl transferase